MKQIKIVPVLVLFFIILLFYIIMFFDYKKQYDINVKDNKSEIARCTELINSNQKFDEKEYCEWKVTTDPTQKPDATYIFFEIVLLGKYSKIIPFLLPLIILFCSLFNICKYFNNGYLKNIYLRTDYYKFINIERYKAYLFSLIIPVINIIIFLLTFFVFGNFDYKYSMAHYDYIIEISFFNNFILNSILYLTIPILHYIFIINIGFIIAKKNNNIFLATIYSFLVYMSLYIFSEGLIGNIIIKNILGLKRLVEYFNFQSFWSFEGIEYPILCLIFNMLLVLIITIIVRKIYSKKESVMIENE